MLAAAAMGIILYVIPHIASSTTLKNIAELIDAGVNAQETLAMLSLPMDFSERVARLKASRRTKLFKINEWIIALSHVSAYETSAARALIELGAHVGSRRRNKKRQDRNQPTKLP